MTGALGCASWIRDLVPTRMKSIPASLQALIASLTLERGTKFPEERFHFLLVGSDDAIQIFKQQRRKRFANGEADALADRVRVPDDRARPRWPAPVL